MGEGVWTGARPGDPMDDDRLLAFALGLDDDPELAQAAAANGALGGRLETVRAEVDDIAAGVRAAVPAPDDAYTDLNDARWAGLQEYFAPAQEKRNGRSGSRRWLRVLAPVMAVALAVAVGVTVIQRQSSTPSMSVAERSGKTSDSAGTSGGASSAAGGAPEVATSSPPEQDGAGSEPAGAGVESSEPTIPDGVLASAAPEPAPEPTTPLTRLAALRDQMNDFALVVLATARGAGDGFQEFVVVRVLRGAGPDVLRLKLAGRLADVGRLHLLFLEPTAQSAGMPELVTSDAPDTGWSEDSSGTVVPTAGDTAEAMMLTSGVPVMYTYEGDVAIARELPAGVDPASVTLP